MAGFDQSLFLLINREWTSPALDLFMAGLSSWAVFIVPVILLAVLMFVLGGFRARAAVLVIALSVGIADGAISSPLKKWIGRPRPSDALVGARLVDLAKTKPRFLGLFHQPEVRLASPKPGPAKGRSIPSSHTLDNFCAAILLACFFRRWGWLYFIVAGLIGYSRIYTGSHWPSDVITSAVFGVGLGLLFLAAASVLWRKFIPHLHPGLAARHPALLG